MLIEKRTVDYVESDIELPFYAYSQGEDYEIFVKIDQTYFYKIQRKFFCGDINFEKHSNNGYIAECWLENKCSKKVWNEALKECKKFINLF